MTFFTAAERNYMDAPPEIEKMARKLIEKFNLVDAGTARIKYVFKYATKLDSELGYINKATGHWGFLTEFDFVITLWADWWVQASRKEQEANLLHQLCHVGVNQNTGKFRVEYHPIECFPEELAHSGAWTPALKTLLSLLNVPEKSK